MIFFILAFIIVSIFVAPELLGFAILITIIAGILWLLWIIIPIIGFLILATILIAVLIYAFNNISNWLKNITKL